MCFCFHFVFSDLFCKLKEFYFVVGGWYVINFVLLVVLLSFGCLFFSCCNIISFRVLYFGLLSCWSFYVICFLVPLCSPLFVSFVAELFCVVPMFFN